MSLRTRITDRLGVRYPVLSAPMDIVAAAPLATAVSAAGGLGLIGGGYGQPLWLEEQLAAVAASGQPFGCGFITWSIDESLIEAALRHRPTAIFLSFGDASRFEPRVHDAGVALICQVHDVAQIREAIALGADVVCAQGGEAGGHGTGARSTFTLVPEAADLLREEAPDVLLLAAGGVGDGRGLAAALMLGADGVLVGTRFWATSEAVVSTGALQRALQTDGDGTRRTSVYDLVRGNGWPSMYTGRVIENEFVQLWHGRERALVEHLEAQRARYIKAVADDDSDTANLIVGESIGLVRHVAPAAEVLRDMVTHAELLLSGQQSVDDAVASP